MIVRFPGGGAEVAQQPGEPSGGKFRDGGIPPVAPENLCCGDRFTSVVTLQIEPSAVVE
ncbi:MAG: hypothetical protein L6W00_19550 [Lentisphaeria bacterium]|nr:MAG: hypothetical protein L6W00_19550 [Lentisphaeria bacterium]